MSSAWDHAFASGSAHAEPTVRHLPIVDWCMLFAERFYEQYCIRRAWRAWRAGSVCAGGVRIGANARLINKTTRDSVRIGANTICKGIIRIEASGSLEIGEEVYIGDQSIISAASAIRIGSGTLVAHGVQIFDNTSHPIEWLERRNHFRKLIGQIQDNKFSIPCQPVSIGENCWLGFGCTILKGVSIGDRSIIGAGAVITKDVPANTLVVSAKPRHYPINASQ